MSQDNEWLFEMRGESLAIIHLTRCSDLDVLKLSAGRRLAPYGLLVHVTNSETAGVSAFGVETKGTDRSLSEFKKSSLVRNLYRQREGLTERLRGQYLPICLFVFNIDTEEGIYTWLVESMPGGLTRLVTETELHFETLDEAGLNRIVTQVSAWHEAREQRLSEPLNAQSAD